MKKLVLIAVFIFCGLMNFYVPVSSGECTHPDHSIRHCLDIGDWPEGPVFPVSGADSVCLESISMDIEPYIWWCMIQNTVFDVTAVYTLASEQPCTATVGIPILSFNLYESHDSFLYPEVLVDGVAVDHQLVLNFSLYSFDESGVYYEGQQINMILHPWIEAALDMAVVAPEAYQAGYEMFIMTDVMFTGRQQHELSCQYLHHNCFNGSEWDLRLHYKLQYATGWSSCGPIQCLINPYYGISSITAPGLSVIYSGDDIEISGDNYSQGIDMYISTEDIYPAEVTMAAGDTETFVPWGYITLFGVTWHNLHPEYGSITQDGVYHALQQGEDEVWIETNGWPDSTHSMVHITTGPAPSPTPECVHDGDVNHSGNLTPDDALTCFQIYLGIYPDPSYEEACCADCNGNSAVTPEDALCIFLNYVNQSCECLDGINLNTQRLL